jgi:hypothetical protein
MSTSHIIEFLWYTQTVLQAAVGTVLWRRKLHKQFPVFFVYLVAQIVMFAASFPFHRHQILFFWMYWIGAALNAVLGFKVIHEIFLDVFRPYHTLKDLGTVIFKWAGAVLLLASVVVAFSTSSERDPLVQAVTSLDRSVRLVQVGLILFLLLFARFLGVSRRQMSFGISLGFGLFAGIELLLLALDSGAFLPKWIFDPANMASYNLSILIWLGYSLVCSESRQSAVNPLQTQRWEHGLSEIQHSLPSDSLIPMFESMVERAITRNSNLDDLPEPDVKVEPPKAFSAASTGSGSKVGN